MLLKGGSISAVTGLLLSGLGNGSWNGTGIDSSAAHADSTRLTAIGSMPVTGSSTATSFDGYSLASSVQYVLLKYTYLGDANLDGQVSGADYNKTDMGYLDHLTGWWNGDFNYDAAVDGSDYTLLDETFNMQGPSLA
jgi:hypothetical protein